MNAARLPTGGGEISVELRGVDNRHLRAIMWPSTRSLADGRRVGLAEVVRFELATGTPIS
jgi:hypothetical protein